MPPKGPRVAKDVAKAKRGVFASGAGGGGTSGPDKIDKRNLEQPCPFCDRTFKQTDRLRAHVQKQHPEEHAEKQAEEEAAEEKRKAEEAHKRENELQRGQKWPRNLLQDWCQKNKKLLPKYSVRKHEGGFTCKVVFPDPKGVADKDVVMFLPKDLVCKDEEEARQQAATLGLSHYLGDRALERVLPQKFVPLWTRIEAEGKEKATKAAERAAKDEERAAKEKERARRAELNKPAQVFMSDHKRRLVEGLLDDLKEDDDDDGGGAGADGAPLSAEAEALAEELKGMGFVEADVRNAATKAEDLPAALDWLCMNIPESRLPQQFAPGAAGQPIGVLFSKLPSTEEAAAQRLASGGYPLGAARDALAAAGQDEAVALAALHAAVLADVAAAEGAPEGPEVPMEDWEREAAWSDEKIVLESIFGEEDVRFVGEDRVAITVRAPEGAAKQFGVKEEVVMELVVHEPPGGHYPNVPPVLAVRAPQLPRSALEPILRAVTKKALELRGAPMVHELASGLPDLLAEAKARPAASPRKAAGGRGRPGSAAGGAAAGVEDAVPEARAQGRDGGRGGRGGRGGLGGGGGRRPRRPELSPEQVAQESTRLAGRHRELQEGKGHSTMRAQRKALPAFRERANVLKVAGDHRVVVLSGETGCGKSTQVPQYLLEDMIEKGAGGACNIIVTQPRRISALALASRVANERGEEVGDTVGYSIRLESKRSARTRLLFCTTGILLRRLLGDPDLAGVTHIVVDEVHERSVDSDLLLLLLRDVMKNLPALRIVLMSATADSELFASYFCGAGCGKPGGISIPGFTHPVRDLFLEDALEMTGTRIGPRSRYARKKGGGGGGGDGDAGGGGAGGGAAGGGGAGGGGAGGGGGCAPKGGSEVAESWEEANVDAEDDAPAPAAAAAPGARDLAGYSRETLKSLETVDESLLNYDLVEAVVSHIIGAEERGGPAALLGDIPLPPGKAKGGAVLVFMPGWQEIKRLQRVLEESPRLREAARGGSLWILPLHGSLSSTDQQKVFRRPPPGVRKVVLATNVAETSVTIDDVTYVVDTGRVKEMGYDAVAGISRLQEAWVSQASGRQRRGRAGRVQPGVCFKLYSSRLHASLPAHQLPEMLRTALEPLCLQVKAILHKPVADILARAITPPEKKAVEAAIGTLRTLRALDKDEELTPLGQHLVRMPVDVRIGKMLLFGAMLQCLDPVLTIAAALSGRSMFVAPMDKREEADRHKNAFAGAAKSDHLAACAAFDGWSAARAAGGRGAARQFADDHFLSDQTLEGMQASRADYAAVLKDLGYVGNDYVNHVRRGSGRSGLSVDTMAENVRVVKAVLCAGFYPNVVRVQHPPKVYAEISGGTKEKDAEARQIKFFTKVQGRCFIHPTSVNFKSGKYESPWLVYSEMVETSKVFIREATMVPTYAVLIFGGEIEVQHEKGLLVVGEWARMEAPARIGVLVRELRGQVDKLLMQKVEDPSMDLGAGRVVPALHELLTSDGL